MQGHWPCFFRFYQQIHKAVFNQLETALAIEYQCKHV